MSTNLLNGEQIEMLIRADLALYCPGATVRFASGREGTISTLKVHAKLNGREAKAVIRTGEREKVAYISASLCQTLTEG